jgi:hypothetical protein
MTTTMTTKAMIEDQRASAFGIGVHFYMHKANFCFIRGQESRLDPDRWRSYTLVLERW